MSTYKRGYGQCFRWFNDGDKVEWRQCRLDEPETRIRKTDENGRSIDGMVVGPLELDEAGEPKLDGPLVMNVKAMLDDFAKRDSRTQDAVLGTIYQCKTCDGTGRVIVDRACEKCDGNGRVEKSKT